MVHIIIPFLLLALTKTLGAEDIRPYKVCALETALDNCHQLASSTTSPESRFTCVTVRDRVDCIDKIARGEADFTPAEPEDAHLAETLHPDKFVVFAQIRDNTETGGTSSPVRYGAVAVVPSGLEFPSLHELRGKRSCHTGFQRTVGWKIPIAMLTELDVLPLECDPQLTSLENDLKRVDDFFSSACISRRWAPDNATEERLKQTYSSLCAACQNSTSCSSGDDLYSGYEGTLRCVASGSGDVAWTKVSAVRKYFGLDPGTTQNADPSDYNFLCSDASRRNITDEPCVWASRPWSVFLASADLTREDLDNITENIRYALNVSQETTADWKSSVIGLPEGSILHRLETAITPFEHIRNANYTSVIERRSCSSLDSVRACTVSIEESQKCSMLSAAAFSRGIRPRIGCERRDSIHDCFLAIRGGSADFITVDGGEVIVGKRSYGLEPIVSEVYGSTSSLYYAVAVVHRRSSIRSLAHLRGKKSCHTGFGRNAGWNMPVAALLRANLLDNTVCPRSVAVSNFFSSSCVPGVLKPENDPLRQNPSSLCDVCVGDIDSGTSTPEDTKCASDIREAYSGYSGAFRCLASGGGDVAFVKHTTVFENTDGANSAAWARELNSHDFQLICGIGGRRPVSDYKDCNLATVPSHQAITAVNRTDAEKEEIKLTLLSLSDTFKKRPDVFKLFGKFNGKSDLIFKNSATGLVNVEDNNLVDLYGDYLDMLKHCDQ